MDRRKMETWKFHIYGLNCTILERKIRNWKFGVVSLFYIGPLWKNNILLSWNVCFSSEIFPVGFTTNIPAKLAGWDGNDQPATGVIKGSFSFPFFASTGRFSKNTKYKNLNADLDHFYDHQEWEGEGEDDQDEREESQQMGTDSWRF